MSYLNDAKKTKDYLGHIKTNIETNHAMLGCIVKTNLMNFYIATSIGKIELDNDVFLCDFDEFTHWAAIS